eukprot:6490574-Prymnesium_polylepis.1
MRLGGEPLRRANRVHSQCKQVSRARRKPKSKDWRIGWPPEADSRATLRARVDPQPRDEAAEP